MRERSPTAPVWRTREGSQYMYVHLEQGERAVRNARAIGFKMGVAHLPIAPSAAPSPEARGAVRTYRIIPLILPIVTGPINNNNYSHY